MIILASQSVIRRKILTDAGVAFEATSPGVDEDAVKAEMLGASPATIAQALARKKALAVSARREGLVIGADSTLEFEGRLYDKAKTRGEARDRLKEWRDRDHRLHSAVVLARGGDILFEELSSPSLTMRDFTDGWLEDYLARGGDDLLASVGCYQLEGEGVQLFTRIEGDYFAVLGMPLLGLLEALRREGAIAK